MMVDKNIRLNKLPNRRYILSNMAVVLLQFQLYSQSLQVLKDSIPVVLVGAICKKLLLFLYVIEQIQHAITLCCYRHYRERGCIDGMMRMLITTLFFIDALNAKNLSEGSC